MRLAALGWWLLIPALSGATGDGTWPMISRASPVTGRPADDVNPITHAAAAWTTLGMASYVPNGR